MTMVYDEDGEYPYYFNNIDDACNDDVKERG
jgi:hypothetical protein